jgi:hypothetical protein
MTSYGAWQRDMARAAIAQAFQNIVQGMDYRDHPLTELEADAAAINIMAAIENYIDLGPNEVRCHL